MRAKITLLYVLMPLSWYIFWLPLGDKTYYGFLVSSGCLLSRKVWWVVRIGSFFSKLRYFTKQNGPKGGPRENEFWLFSNTKMNVTNSSSGKSRWKKWGHLSSFHVSFVSYGPKIVKKVHFLQLCADLSKKSKSIKATYIYASESSPSTLSENGVGVQGVQPNVHEILAIKISKYMLTQQNFNKILGL